MLGVADRQQSFFDAAWRSDLLLEDSIYVLLAEHGGRIVRDEDFAGCSRHRTWNSSERPTGNASNATLSGFMSGLTRLAAVGLLRHFLVPYRAGGAHV